MGKGVLLDNGKKAKSSMALYWKAAQNKNTHDKTVKKEVKEVDEYGCAQVCQISLFFDRHLGRQSVLFLSGGSQI